MTLLQGDCLELLKTIPDGSIDMVLTDPPYGTTACKWDNLIDFAAMWAQIKRVIKANGAVLLFGSEPFSSHLRLSMVKEFKYDWIWKKTCAKNFMNAKKQPLRDCETISVFYSKQPNYQPQGLSDATIDNSRPNHKIDRPMAYSPHSKKARLVSGKTGYPKTIIEFANPNKGTVHPTQKPVALLEYLIKTYTLPGETVLDFTMGSGSTGVACKNTGRDFIGIELDEKYFEIAKQRISATL